MSTPPRPPSPNGPPRAASAPATGSSASSGAPSLDPVKILKKYFWLLAFSGVFGIGLGVGAYFLFSKIYPLYTSEALWLARPPRQTLYEAAAQSIKTEELQRYMATQAATMASDRVLQAVVDNPRISQDAPEWFAKFSDEDGFDKGKAFKWLEENVKARAQSRTELVSLSLSWHTPVDTTSLVRLISSEFRSTSNREESKPLNEQRDLLRDQIDELTTQIERLANDRSRLIENSGVDTIDQRASEITASIQVAAESMGAVRELLSAAEVQLEEFEAALQNPAGITYPESISSQVELVPIVLEIKNQVELLEAQDQSLAQLGLGPKHPDRRGLRAQIEGHRLQLDLTREQQRRELFDTQLQQTRLGIRQFRAQEAELQREIEQRRIELNELTRLQGAVADIDRAIEGLALRKDTRESELSNLDGLARQESARQIELVQSANVPDEMSFPRLEQTVPAGFLLCVGGTAGLVVLRELLDQRVKGPADLSIVRGAKVLGVIPELSQDPANPKRVETAFRERPNSVFAESVRQTRNPVLERLAQSGFKTLMLVGCTPKTGTTSVLLNLADACIRSDLRVLVVDANFRRPSLHRMLGSEETPGLADVLAGEADVFESIQTTESGFDVLSVGTEEHRIYERTSTRPMDKFVEDVESKYDLILIDVAPAMVSGDARGLANHVDATILVARALGVKKGMVSRLYNELNGCRAQLLGIILNAVRPSAGGYFKTNIQATHAYQNTKKRKAKGPKDDKKADPSLNGHAAHDEDVDHDDLIAEREAEADSVGSFVGDEAGEMFEAQGADDESELPDTGLSDTLASDASPLSLDDLDPESTAHGEDPEDPNRS